MFSRESATSQSLSNIMLSATSSVVDTGAEFWYVDVRGVKCGRLEIIAVNSRIKKQCKPWETGEPMFVGLVGDQPVLR